MSRTRVRTRLMRINGNTTLNSTLPRGRYTKNCVAQAIDHLHARPLGYPAKDVTSHSAPQRNLRRRLLHPFFRLALPALVTGAAAALILHLLPINRQLIDLFHPTLEDQGGSLVVTLALADAVALRTRDPTIPDYPADPVAWRRLHAHLVERLLGAGAAVVAFDVIFESASPERSSELIDALRSARGRTEEGRAGQGRPPVVLGVTEHIPQHELYRLAYPGLLLGLRDRWHEVGSVVLFKSLAPSGEAVPALALQAYALALDRRPAQVAGGHVVFPPRLVSGSILRLRFSSSAIDTLDYHQVFELPDELLRARVFGKAVFVGLVGDWSQGVGALDVHRVPFVPPGQGQRTRSGRLEGVFLHAYAYNQLLANRIEARRYLFDLWSARPHAALLLGAMLLAALPVVLLGLRSSGTVHLFSSVQPVRGWLARLRPWPRPLGVSMLLLFTLAGVLLRAAVLFPIAGFLASGLVAAMIFSLPALRVRRAAKRLVAAFMKVQQVSHSGAERLVRNPPGGPRELQRELEQLALDPLSIVHQVRTLHEALGEAERVRRPVDAERKEGGEPGRKSRRPVVSTYYERIPRAFFQHYGWLEPAPSRQPTAEYLSRPPGSANELTLHFCGTALRLLRNYWAHPELEAHNIEYAQQALEHFAGQREPLAAAARHRLQLTLLQECTRYLERLASWLERDLGNEN